MKNLILSILLSITCLIGYAQSIPNVSFPTTEPTADAYAVNITNYGTSYNNKIAFVEFRTPNGGPATINITPSGSTALGAKPMRIFDGSDWVPLGSGDINGDTSTWVLHYHNQSGTMHIWKHGSGTGGGGGPDTNTSFNALFDRTKTGDFTIALADTSAMIYLENGGGPIEITIPDFSAVSLNKVLQFAFFRDMNDTVTFDVGGETVILSAANLGISNRNYLYLNYRPGNNQWYASSESSGGGGGGGAGNVASVVAGNLIDVDATDPDNPIVAVETGDKGDITIGSNTLSIDALAVTNAEINDVAVGKVTGLGTGVATWLATPSDENLASALTGETGTAGGVVFSASPTLTGTPLTTTASAQDSTTQMANTAWVQRNALSLGTSVIYPSQNSYNAYPISTLGNGQESLEFLNHGNPYANTEDRNVVPGGVHRHTGSILLSRNVFNNVASTRWEQLVTTATAYGAAWTEIGGEGVNFMAVPPATHPYSIETGGMNLSVRHSGARSVTGFTTGYTNQGMAPFLTVFETSASGLGQWLENTGAAPMFHALSEETKGSGGALGNFYTAESHGSSYGGIQFKSSNGTYGTPSNSSSNKVVGSVYSTPYGGAYRRTAEMQFITRGTVTGSAVGQSILIRTSPDSDANIRDLFEFTYDGTVKTINAPFRITNTSVTTVPVYSSFAGFSPANTASDVGIFQHLSTSTGGTAIYGLGTTSTASTAIPLGFIGALGATSPTAPAILFSGRKNNGSNSLTDLASTETVLMIRNNATDLVGILGNGTTTVGSIAGSATRLNASGTIQLYNSGSAGVFGVGSSANFTYTDKSFQAPLIRLTASPSGTASSAPIIDPTNNQIRLLVRPGSSGYMYQLATFTDVLDATTLTSTTGGLLLSHTHSPASGSTTFNAVGITPTINQTGTFSGSYTALRYNPTLTAVLGTHYSIVSEPLARGGFGAGSAPSAQLHIGASTTAASTASIKINEGSRQTSPEDGTINYVSNNLEFVENTTVYTIAKTLTNTATLNFDLTSVNSEDLTITVTGATAGDAVSVGVDAGSATANVIYTWWVSATNTVTVRASRIDVASGADPASGTFRAAVIHY